MTQPANSRTRKDLDCTADASAYQKAFGATLRQQVVESGEPFAVAQADTPHEIFHAMDIPLVSNQWWSAYISAKRLSTRYFQTMDELGYPANRCRYCSLGLACTLANDPASASGPYVKGALLHLPQDVRFDLGRALPTAIGVTIQLIGFNRSLERTRATLLITDVDGPHAATDYDSSTAILIRSTTGPHNIHITHMSIDDNLYVEFDISTFRAR